MFSQATKRRNKIPPVSVFVPMNIGTWVFFFFLRKIYVRTRVQKITQQWKSTLRCPPRPWLMTSRLFCLPLFLTINEGNPEEICAHAGGAGEMGRKRKLRVVTPSRPPLRGDRVSCGRPSIDRVQIEVPGSETATRHWFTANAAHKASVTVSGTAEALFT